MKAILYHQFGEKPGITTVPDPAPFDDGVVIKVEATGLCLSDWHGWKGHDPDITLPHVPGHELAGTVEAIGKHVSHWKPGDRVTLPFVCGCGICGECRSGNHQVCDTQFQPGFTHWGSFAEFVAVKYADTNLVALPDEMDFVTASSLGCRFVTSFRGIVHQGKVQAGQWVAVHGCGGVGLSAVMIANALGANVIAVDIVEEKLKRAESLGAVVTLNAARIEHIPEAIQQITWGGAHVSVDALGTAQTCYQSISCLRKRGKHIQIGLMPEDPLIPMGKIVAQELELLGSHGMAAWEYPQIFSMIKAGKLSPEKLIGKTISLEEAAKALPELDKYREAGVMVVDDFGS